MESSRLECGDKRCAPPALLSPEAYVFWSNGLHQLGGTAAHIAIMQDEFG